jgi:hypothetical protein
MRVRRGEVPDLSIITIEEQLAELRRNLGETDELTQLTMACIAHISRDHKEASQSMQRQIDLLKQRGVWLLDLNYIPKRSTLQFSIKHGICTLVGHFVNYNHRFSVP